jgi:hypothetical protein
MNMQSGKGLKEARPGSRAIGFSRMGRKEPSWHVTNRAQRWVFYDPIAPQVSCLDRTDTSGISVMWILAVGGTVLASLLVWLVS